MTRDEVKLRLCWTNGRTNEINRYDYARCLISPVRLLVVLHVDK